MLIVWQTLCKRTFEFFDTNPQIQHSALCDRNWRAPIILFLTLSVAFFIKTPHQCRKIKQRKESEKLIIPNSVRKHTNLSLLFRQGLLQARWDSGKEFIFCLEVAFEGNLFTTFSPKLIVLIILMSILETSAGSNRSVSLMYLVVVAMTVINMHK